MSQTTPNTVDALDDAFECARAALLQSPTRPAITHILEVLRHRVEASARALAAIPEPTRCPYCDDTGDVHSIDGEWRGRCHCPAAQQAGGVPAGFVAEAKYREEVGEIQRLERGKWLTPREAKDALESAQHERDAAIVAAPSPSAVQPLSEAQRVPMSEWRAEKMAREWMADSETDAEDLIRQVEDFHGIVTPKEPTS